MQLLYYKVYYKIFLKKELRSENLVQQYNTRLDDIIYVLMLAIC